MMLTNRRPHAIALAFLLVGGCGHSTRGETPATSATATPAAQDQRPIEPGPRRIRTSDGVELYLEIAGQGPPCLFVHGGPGQGAQSFQRMGGDRLESTLTMIYLDQRGSGRSANAADYSLDRVVADFEEIRKALGLDKIFLLAHSFGGILAVRYAEQYPERVRGLVLANTSLWFPHSLRAQLAYIQEQVGDTSALPDVSSLNELRAAYDRARQELSTKDDYVPLLATDLQTMQLMRRVDADPPRNQDFASHAKIEAGSEYALDFTAGTANVQAPVLVITGDRDHAVGPDHFRLFRFPRQTVQHIDGSHLLYYEKSEAFVAAVSNWIRSVSGGSGR
jgi:proline iminopeptidase